MVKMSPDGDRISLLKLLMERKGRVQTRDHLLVNVWHYDTDIETRTVDTHVRRVGKTRTICAHD